MGRICVSGFQGGSEAVAKWTVSGSSGLVSGSPVKLELWGGSGRGMRKELVTEGVCLGELGKEAGTWTENQVMHRKK